MSRSGSGKNDSPAKRSRPKKPVQDVKDSDGAPNPDPAVFEAAFVIDDSEEFMADTVSEPTVDGKRPEEEPKKEDGGDAPENTTGNGDTPEPRDNGDSDGRSTGAPNKTEKKEAAKAVAKVELPQDVRVRLRKLEKLEATYPELLRSYRIAHGRATSIEPFEKALRENTPLTSIRDPDALVEYLNQLNLKADMVMDELKRVSAEKDTFRKQAAAADKEVTSLKEDIAALKAGPQEPSESPAPQKHSADDDQDAETGETKPMQTPSAGKSPVAQVLGIFSPRQKPTGAAEATEVQSEDLFSFDNEIPQLQAELASRTEEVDRLKSDVEELKAELSTAKESSAGLVQSLEAATLELSESKDAQAAQQSLKTELDARNVELGELSGRFNEIQNQLRDKEKELEAAASALEEARRSHSSELKAAAAQVTQQELEVKKLSQAKDGLDEQITNLTARVDALRAEKADADVKVQQLNKHLQELAPTSPTAPTADAVKPASAASKKKKNRKGKGTGAVAPAEAGPSEDRTLAGPSAPSSRAVELEAEVALLKEDVKLKEERIEKLSARKKTEDDLREEIEGLQENLLTIGQDHVEAKEKIKALQAEKVGLQERIVELEKEAGVSKSAALSSSKVQGELDALRRDYDGIKAKSATLQSDLGAAQQLAQTRYKELAELRDVLQKAQPELKSLRQDSAALKKAREELAAKSSELRGMEKREKELKIEVTRAQRLAADRDTEIKSLREKITAETNQRLRLEDDKRVAGRDLRRSEAEKIELSAKEEKASRELQKLQDDMVKVQPRIQELEEEVAKLRKRQDAAREEAELKGSQYANAQNLLGSMRDQTAELSIQLKESQAQAESLDEELAECRKLLGERTREAETMRRLLADVDERADSKVREMRTKMEAAVEERDRFEDESSTLARRKAREAEDLRTKIRDLEREVKTLANEKDDLEQREKDWRRRREELEAVEERAGAEVADMRSTVSSLRTTLDASEQQVRDVEKQKADLRRMLDELRQRYEKLSRDTKAKLGSTAAAAAAAAATGSGRSSMDSSAGANGTAAQGGADAMYLKTILLQFLEQKDNKLRAQLVPVLGKLLRFDR